MSPLRIVVSESADFSPAAVELLRASGVVTLGDLDRPGLLAAVCDADVLWVRLRHRIDREVMAVAPHLRFIVTATTGLNHIDTEEAERRGIRVISLRGETEFLDEIVATAEHTLALALALLRHVPAAAAHVVDGGWNRDRFKGAEIRGKTVGVVGYGRLGRIVARYFSALGARIVAADPAIDTAKLPPFVEAVAFDELLSRADIVTLHVALDVHTAGFFGRQQFRAMKRGAWFVNTSRGELIDEGGLLDALSSGHLAGAALDVIADEHAERLGARPVVDYARHHDHLIITPHVGGCTAESMEKTEVFLATRLRDALLNDGVSEGHFACAE